MALKRHIFYMIMPLNIGLLLLLDRSKLSYKVFYYFGIFLGLCLPSLFLIHYVEVLPPLNDGIVKALEGIDKPYAIYSWWDYGHVYHSQAPFPTVAHRGSPPGDSTVIRALFSSNERIAHKILKNKSKGSPYYLIVNSRDIEKQDTLEQYYNLSYNGHSIMNRMLLEDPTLTLFEPLGCGITEYTKTCVYMG